MVSLGFVVCALIEFAFILLLNRRVTKKKNTLKYEQMSKTNNTNNLSIVTPSRRVAPLAIVEEKERMHLKIVKEMQHRKKLMKEIDRSFCSVPSVHVVDFVAFWVHLFFFSLYNCIYWSENLDF